MTELAGALGFEPRSSVLETDSLTVELTPLYLPSLLFHPEGPCCLDGCEFYFVSLWGVCFRQRLQNFENSSRPVVVFLFFVVE